MSKNREAVTCNGRSAFYACMWDDIRQCAMDNGWAVALHGSLNSDMDIMAMPWVENAVTFSELINKISELFDGNVNAEFYSINYTDKPHNRVVATIPIFGDFYLDISTIINVDDEVLETKDLEGSIEPANLIIFNYGGKYYASDGVAFRLEEAAVEYEKWLRGYKK